MAGTAAGSRRRKRSSSSYRSSTRAVVCWGYMWIMVNNTGTAIVVLGQWKGHGSYHNSSDKVCGEQRGVIFAALASCCHCVVSQQRFSFLRTNTYVTSKPSLRGLLGFLQQKTMYKTSQKGSGSKLFQV